MKTTVVKRRREATKEELYQFHVRIPASIMKKIDEKSKETGASLSFFIIKGLKLLLEIES